MFYNHKKYRDPLVRFTPRFREFLTNLDASNASMSKSMSSALQQFPGHSSSVLGGTRDATSSLPNKQPCLSVGEGGGDILVNESAKVRASSYS
jgi:hypothetical protein